MTAAVFKIIPTTQQYDWGKTGRSSKVAQFAASSQLPGFQIDEAAPYAELWMGTHPKSPSLVRSTGQVLSEHLASHPELIGQKIIDKFSAGNGNLPFLFKVLSIEKALSIQTHPDKDTAEKLHREQPDIYKDDNHKPEMAIAITPFDALCGFRPLPDIASALHDTPEFRSLIAPDLVDAFLSKASSSSSEGREARDALKGLFGSLMRADAPQVQAALKSLIARYKSGDTIGNEDGDVVKLVFKLDEQFPDDIGIFCVFVLNYLHLNPGEAIFLGAGEPHAYIYGECIETMANSDNVIRAGLTPKLRDIPVLVAGLTYMAADPSKHVVKLKSFQSSGPSVLYDPPIPEFSVIRMRLYHQDSIEFHEPRRGPSLAIVTAGKGLVSWYSSVEENLELSLGDVFFIGAGTAIRFKNTEDTPLILYRAFVEA
ncbi:mannose-6-phosphate isomerase [Pholiota conissans]|uniref:Mannose-6-phosphate isomerase n=1 Tax=Pholiota conissans TaxID=109636 RepID=A0A9P5ZA77_9AGAR|nr:mannose-6-phosphate isomerase [Pholiota conissans]